MLARIRMNDFWFVAVGAWTQNGERATEFESITALLAALKWIINEVDHKPGALRSEVHVIFNK